jgi:hypothetical protein
MTATSRYWDHERCCWVNYASATADPQAQVAEVLPEQRVDEETLPAQLAAP